MLMPKINTRKPVAIELDHSELGTIRLALLCWETRCKGEAEIMDQLAREEGDKFPKAEANARASREFQRQARALLDRLP